MAINLEEFILSMDTFYKNNPRMVLMDRRKVIEDLRKEIDQKRSKIEEINVHIEEAEENLTTYKR